MNKEGPIFLWIILITVLKQTSTMSMLPEIKIEQKDTKILTMTNLIDPTYAIKILKFKEEPDSIYLSSENHSRACWIPEDLYNRIYEGQFNFHFKDFLELKSNNPPGVWKMNLSYQELIRLLSNPTTDEFYELLANLPNEFILFIKENSMSEKERYELDLYNNFEVFLHEIRKIAIVAEGIHINYISNSLKLFKEIKLDELEYNPRFILPKINEIPEISKDDPSLIHGNYKIKPSQDSCDVKIEFLRMDNFEQQMSEDLEYALANQFHLMRGFGNPLIRYKINMKTEIC